LIKLIWEKVKKSCLSNSFVPKNYKTGSQFFHIGLLLEECGSDEIRQIDYIHKNNKPLTIIVAGARETVYYYNKMNPQINDIGKRANVVKI